MRIDNTLWDKLWRVLFVFVIVAIMGGVSCRLMVNNILAQVKAHGNEVVLLAKAKIQTLGLEAATALTWGLFFIERMEASNLSTEEIERSLVQFDRSMHGATGGPAHTSAFKKMKGVMNGRYMDNSGATSLPPDFRFEETPWYKSAAETPNTVAYSSPYISSISGGDHIVSVSLARPALNGTGINMLALDIDLKIISRYMDDIRRATGGYGILLDRNLVLISHVNEEYLGKKLTDLGGHFNELAQRIATEGTLSAESFIDVEEQERVIFVEQLPNGWYVGSVTPTAVYRERAYYVIWLFSGVSLLTAFLLSLLVLRLHAAKEASDIRSQSKSNFLAQMSHEIRTPMNAIVGLTELILRSSNELLPQTIEYAVGIKQASVNLLAIINSILDFSKIEAGKLTLVTEHYLFSSVIHDVISIIAMRIREKSLHFVVHIDGALPNTLIGDAVRVRQILLNLLSNAASYTIKGFILLQIEGEQYADNRIVLTIRVADSGIGIKGEDKDRLFGDFERLHTHTLQTEGTGLGLPITKALLTMMDGDIRMESEYGRGSTFTATLWQRYDGADVFAAVENPEAYNVLVYETRRICAKALFYSLENLGIRYTAVRNRSEFREALQTEQYSHIFLASFLYSNLHHLINESAMEVELCLLSDEVEVPGEMDVRILMTPVHSLTLANLFNHVEGQQYHGDELEAQPKFFHAPRARILLVDDIKTNISVAEGLMLPYRMQMDAALSGREAVLMVKQYAYDLIFMDHMMPGLDGIETTKRIRDMDGEYFQTVPIVALTANAVSGMKEMFLANGMNDFVSKPIAPGKLHNVLLKWIPKEKQEKRIEMPLKKERGQAPDIVLEGLDTIQGLARAGGSRESYLRILAVFYDDALLRISEMRSALATGDIKNFTICIHALKSASGNVGAIELSDMAAALEAAGREEDAAFIGAHIEGFIDRLHAMLNGLNVLFIQEKSKAESMPGSVDAELLRQELPKLRDGLENFDAGAIEEAMNALQSGVLNEENRHTLDEIARHILLFEYKTATAALDALSARSSASRT